MADEIDSLTKQLNTQQDKLNDEAQEKLVKQIETKKKSFERTQQDAQEDYQNQQGEIGNKILTKMAPLIVKYAGDNGYGMIVDTSQPWPRGPVIWYGPAVDITESVVQAYNTQSGVAPPPAGSTPAKPATKSPSLAAGRRRNRDSAETVATPRKALWFLNLSFWQAGPRYMVLLLLHLLSKFLRFFPRSSRETRSFSSD